jgi:Protein of unknown function (DUF4038)/Putative collagen-binding domain of a collagenase
MSSGMQGKLESKALIQMSRRQAVLFALTPIVLCALAAGAYLWHHADHTCIAEPSYDFPISKAVFPLSVSPSRRYLVDANQTPFLIHGDAGWSVIAQLTREDAEIYLEDRRRRGFNLVLINLLEHWFADHPPLDVYGTAPFTSPGDFSTPNAAYFSHAREIVRSAGKKGIAVLLCPAYLGGDGGQEGWYREMKQNGPEKLRAYGEYVGAHFREFENVIWLEGGDYLPPAEDLALVDAVAQGIKKASPLQLQAAHWNPETSGFDVKMAATSLDLNTTYTYHPAYLKGLADDAHGKGPPHFLVESKYELERESTQRWIRAQSYYALLTGAMGELYGNRWIYGFTRPTLWGRLTGRNWITALDSPAARSMGHVRALFAKLPWTSLVPDETFEVLTTGQGWKGSLNYPVLAWSPDGRLALAYVPTAEGVSINLDKLSRSLRARWYDPTNGQFSEALGSPISASGTRPFEPPGSNAAGDSDWLLLLETAS